VRAHVKFHDLRSLKPGPHKIQGIGAGITPDTLDLGMVDRPVRRASSREFPAARPSQWRPDWRPTPSSPGNTIVVVLPDSGERYLSSILFEGIV